MPDWSKSMKRSYKFYEVDPDSWNNLREITTVCDTPSIDRDLDSDTLGSISLPCTGQLNECYVRVYMETLQNGVSERFCMGTFLIQTPSISYNGFRYNNVLTGYGTLSELLDVPPPIGYTALKGDNIVDLGYALISDNTRVPVNPAAKAVTATKVLEEHFVADPNETWYDFIVALIAKDNRTLSVDTNGRISIVKQESYLKRGATTVYNDDNSSILLAPFTVDRDLYAVPNVVEVIYQTTEVSMTSTAVNNNPSSPISLPNRGRKVVKRIINPSIPGTPTQDYLDSYAEDVLKSLSMVEYKISYEHGYCDNNIGDVVMLNYTSAGLRNVKAMIVSQSIQCTPSCLVSETAVFSSDMLGGDQFDFI